jgi:hypothetical protein
MSLPGRQRRRLRRIDAAVCRSDPHLASMLSIFARLTAGEAMPGREQLRAPPPGRARAALAAAAVAAASLIARAAGVCRRGLRRAAAVCTAVVTGLARPRRRARRAASSGSPPAGTRASGRPDQPGPPGR